MKTSCPFTMCTHQLVFGHNTDNVHSQVPQDHSQVTARKSLMDVRDPLATLDHEYNYRHFRPMLRDVQPSPSTPICYRHAFLMTCEMVFRYVVNIQSIASLSNIRALRRPAPILIPLLLASLIPRHHLHIPSSIDFPLSSTDLTT